MAVDSAKTSEQRLIGPDFREDSVQLDGQLTISGEQLLFCFSLQPFQEHKSEL